jgi:hypothetical protein
MPDTARLLHACHDSDDLVIVDERVTGDKEAGSFMTSYPLGASEEMYLRIISECSVQ